MDRTITIQKTTDICSCNGCGSRNYNSTLPNADHTRRVDTLYELQIGSQCVCLCTDCLDALTMQIAVVLGAALLGENHHDAQ